MKKAIIILFFFIFYSCQQEQNPVVIEFPSKGASGTNLLSLKDSSQLEGYIIYSLAANIDPGASLKVSMIQKSADERGLWEIATPVNGWTIGTFDKNTKTQVFTANKEGAIDVPIMFTFKKGAFVLQVFKNNGSPQEKWFTWETK